MAEPDNRPPWERYGGGSRDRSVFPEVNNPSGDNRPPWERYGNNQAHTPITEEERPLGTSEFERRHPRFIDRAMGALVNWAQGAPIIGGMVNETQASRDYGRTYPIYSAMGRFGTGVGAYLPQARAMQGLSTVAGNLVRRMAGAGQRSTPGLVSNTLGQGLLGGYTNVVDTAVRRRSAGQESSLDDLVLPGALGVAAGMLGPLGSRLWAPAGVGNRVRYDPRYTPPIIHDLQDAPLIRGISANPGFRTAFRQDIRDAIAAGRFGPGRRPPRLDQSMRFINAERGRQLAERTGNVIGNIAPPLAGAVAGWHMGSGPLGALYGALSGAGLNVAGRALARSPAGQRYLGRTISSEWQSLIDALGPAGVTQVPLQDRQ